MGLFSSISHLFHHVEKDAVHTLLPYLEGEIGKFIIKAVPLGETLVLALIRGKGSISDADRTAAASQLKQLLIASADQAAVDAGAAEKGVQITDGLARTALDLAYHKLKFIGAIIPSDNKANIGIAATKVDPSTAVIGPAAVPTH